MRIRFYERLYLNAGEVIQHHADQGADARYREADDGHVEESFPERLLFRHRIVEVEDPHDTDSDKQGDAQCKEYVVDKQEQIKGSCRLEEFL